MRHDSCQSISFPRNHASSLGGHNAIFVADTLPYPRVELADVERLKTKTKQLQGDGLEVGAEEKQRREPTGTADPAASLTHTSRRLLMHHS
uniref:Uncharacterized protein n=1 Tax=Mycena chlorophos TaxID=658473 RepID=A0ABQ0LAG3_MYCCL|nr:predicted protein [Mycena chlorophos]